VLIEPDDASQIILPDDCWLIGDKSGKLWRECDVYILKCKRVSSKNVEFDPQDLSEAEDYWGPRDKWAPYQFAIPRGKWKKVAQVVRIGYRRGRTGNWLHPGPQEPPFEKPVSLYVNERGDGWRLRLPGGCVLDDRGFIYPLSNC
jgi:hypothetical protein